MSSFKDLLEKVDLKLLENIDQQFQNPKVDICSQSKFMSIISSEFQMIFALVHY